MIAKKIKGRRDKRSSIKKLINYITSRESVKASDDHLPDNRDRERDGRILVAAARDLRQSARHRGAIGPFDTAAAAAIRRRFESVKRSIEPNEHRDEGSKQRRAESFDEAHHQSISELINDDIKVERRLAAAARNLQAAARRYTTTEQFTGSVRDGIRARRAYLARAAQAVATRHGLNEGRDHADYFTAGVRYISRDGVEVATNCDSVDDAITAMQDVAAENPRVKFPLYHMVISWMDDERPEKEEAFAAVEYTLQKLGFAENQFVAAIHRDTDNVHVHVVVNKVHPESFKVVDPSNDHYIMDKAMRELEIRFNRKHAPGPYIVVERNGQKVVTKAAQEGGMSRKKRVPDRAEQMEAFAGEESLFTYVRGEPRKSIMALLKLPSTTWQAIHDEFRKHGLELRIKGSGLAVYVVGADDITPVKASQVHESLSLTRLEKRLGTAFAPAKEDAPQQREDMSVAEDSKPKSSTTAPMYGHSREMDHVEHRQARTARDPEAREARKQARAKEREDLKLRYQLYRDGFVIKKIPAAEVKARYAELNNEFKARREAIKSGVLRPLERKVQYSFLAAELSKAKLALGRTIRAEREALASSGISKPMTYRDWVHAQAQTGDEAAIVQLRGWHYAEQRAAKEKSEGSTENGMDNGDRDGVSAFHYYHPGHEQDKPDTSADERHSAEQKTAQPHGPSSSPGAGRGGRSGAATGDEAGPAPGGAAAQGTTHQTYSFDDVRPYHVYRSGAVLYSQYGQQAFVDHGRKVRMVREHEPNADHILAMLVFSSQKFRTMKLVGDDAFIERSIDLIAKNGLNVKLSDPAQQSALDAAKARYGVRNGPRPRL